MGPERTTWATEDHTGPYRATQDHTGPHETTWGHTEPHGTTWDHIVPPEPGSVPGLFLFSADIS